MFRTILFEIRDFVYVWLKKNHGEEYAQKEFLFRVGVFWTLYYFAIVFAIVLIFVSFFKFSQETIILLRKNLFIKLLGGGLIFLPYYLWLRFYLFKLLEVVPENLELDDSTYRKLAWKTFFIFVFGLVIILIIALINNIVRHGHF
jgi:hypothetical protein